jgi:hypothetical protein
MTGWFFVMKISRVSHPVSFAHTKKNPEGFPPPALLTTAIKMRLDEI